MSQFPKRRAGAVLAAVLLVVSMLPVMLLLARAENGDMLMVAGYDIVTPVKAQMPFETGNILYVPVVLFSRQDVSVTVTKAGVTLANVTRTIFFDTAQNLAFDDRNNTYVAKALYRNGYWFVPAQFTADRLDLFYSRHAVEPVGFVRVSRKEFLLSDEILLRTYAARAQRVWDDYLSTGTTLPPAFTTTPAFGTTATTPPSSGTSATAPPVTTPPPKSFRVFLLIRGLSYAQDTLARLQSGGVLASFLVSQADIEDNSNLIRQIAAAGHSFVLSANSLREANAAADALFLACKRPCFAIMPGSPLSEDGRAGLTLAGFSVWESSLLLDGGASYQDLSVLQSYLNRRANGALVPILPGENGRTLLSSIFSLLRAEAPEYLPILPIDAPVLP